MKSFWKKAVSVLTCAALLGGACLPAFADGGAQSPVTKDETVYLILNPDGSVKQQTVSDWLHCDSGLAGVEDTTCLTDVVNLKSDVMPSVSDGKITWDTQDTDVYYQGTADKTPPVTASVRWTLDGEEMTAAELAGKSGHVKLTISLQNNEKQTRTIGGEQRDVYTPFVALVAADLPREHFSGVAVPHGTVQTDSQNQLACAAAMPGMRATFDGLLTGRLKGLQDYFLDEVVIEADAEDFVMPTLLIAASTSLDELEEQFDVPDVDGEIGELRSGTQQLDDGAAQLAEAAGLLNGKMGEFASQYNAFDAGVDAALAGSAQVKQGADALLAGAQSLAGGASQMKDGTAALSAGASALRTQLDEQLLPGLAAASAQQAALEEEMAAASAALGSVPETSDLAAASDAVNTALTAAASGAGGAAQQSALTAAASASDATRANCRAAVQAALDADPAFTEEQKAAVLAAVDSAAGYDASADAAAANAAAQTAVGAQAQAVQTALAPLAGLDTTSLKTAFGAVSADASSLLSQMSAMTGKLYNEADNSQTLYGGAVQLADGASALLAGASGIADGASQLGTGASQLASGAAGLQSGLQQLSDSSKVIRDALAQFCSGTSQLATGAGELHSGTGELRSRTGSAAGELEALQLGKISEIADALEEQANAYTSYTGSSEGVRASVKFVMKVEAPEIPETSGTDGTPAAEPAGTGSFWQRVRDLLPG